LFASVFILFRGWPRKHTYFETGHSGPSKVVDFGTNRKRVCNLLHVLVNNRTLMPYSYLASFQR